MDDGLGLGSRDASAERFVTALGGLAPGSEVDRPGPVCAATCQPVVPSGVSSLRERFEAFWQGVRPSASRSSLSQIGRQR